MGHYSYESSLYLAHHGIKGQKWGDRNGPPYPLTGGAMSSKEKKKNKRLFESKKVYEKKHRDQYIERGSVLSTLSYDKNRTEKGDMFYAAYDRSDKHLYNALFNKKMPQTIYDSDGTPIGTGNFYKFRINNEVTDTTKVASEDSGVDAFAELFSGSRDFYNFVVDENRMESKFVTDKYKFKGYRESKEALDRIRKSDVASYEDIEKVYRMFNYVIPNEDSDTVRQRSRIFSELKKQGYGAMLDTNDALYGGFKANAPVIVFDRSAIVIKDANRVTMASHEASVLITIGKKALAK